jgi:hypothetical protein
MYASQTPVYPHLRHFLERQIGPRTRRPEVWRALRELTGLSEPRLSFALRWARGPLIRIIPIRTTRGRFTAGAFVRRAPDSILLNRGHVRQFEQMHHQECAKLQMEAIVLHEIAHWGWWHTHRHPEPRGREIGEEFEHRAYGHRPSEYAMCTPSARAQMAERNFEDMFGSPIDVVVD